MKSKKYSLNPKDLKDIGIMAGWTGLGTVVMFLLEQVVPSMNFGTYAPYITPLIPVITYSAKKYFQGK